ncbi:transcriptional regulator [Gracilibacillus boraciitolerans JCM 21714]|uniref:Transcriptional regulator n=1 Tax=Gracilibacillus boraciitolerans JCM 21714 TaxID=1298598 RepID=W4VCY0_9BACI|nr:helix-turn-helix domain-containing protein [Gracilibacillus boraciitolerans]GAE91270.1 transcriptional regulator [Gracilibacillus boraciitolerans JCM 21714]
MKINSNNFNMYEDLFHKLPVGIILINKQDNITLINQTAGEIISSEADHLIGREIQTILKNPSYEQVKQLHLQVEKKDTIKETNQHVVTTYTPFLSNSDTLDGVLLVMESLDNFKQKVSALTEADFYHQILQELLKTDLIAFRILQTDGIELFSSELWKSEMNDDNPYFVDWVDQLAMKTLTARRERSDRYQVESTAMNAVDIITKPIKREGMLSGCIQFLKKEENSALKQQLKITAQMLRKLEKTYQIEDIIGNSPEINIAREQAKIYAETSAPVLLRGEKGTGKAMLARIMHMTSNRKYYPFIRVNSSFFISAADLKEAFVSISKRGGKNGTVYIYFNEEPSILLQNKLLSLMENQPSIRFVFGVKEPSQLAEWHSAFLDELQRYQIVLPALKQRINDLPLLIDHFVNHYNQKYDTQIRKIEEDLMDCWKTMNWPGNIMELEDKIEQIAKNISSFTETVGIDTVKNLPKNPNTYLEKDDDGLSLQMALDQFEREYLFNALEKHQYNKTKTAKALGVSVRNLYYKMDKYKIERGGVT